MAEEVRALARMAAEREGERGDPLPPPSMPARPLIVPLEALVRPREDLLISPEGEARLLEANFGLAQAAGRLTYYLSSWERVVAAVNGGLLLRVLQSLLPPDDAAAEIVGAELVLLRGVCGYREEPGPAPVFGFLAILPDMRPRATFQYNCQGRCYSKTRVNFDGGAEAPVPSLEALGLEEQLQAAEAAARKLEDAYLFKVDQTYSCTHRPGRPLEWESDLVLLRARREVPADVVLSLSAAWAGAVVELTACSLGGNEVARLRMDPGASCREMRATLSQRLGVRERQAKLLAGGALLGEEDLDSLVGERLLAVERTPAVP